MVDSAKSILNKCVPDVYIYTDHMRGASSGKSPGFGLCLVAETTNGTFYTAEANSNAREDKESDKTSAESSTPSIPEDVGLEAAGLLLDEVCCSCGICSVSKLTMKKSGEG